MIKEMHSGEMANTSVISRIKQVAILIALIVAGIMISMATETKPENHSVTTVRGN